MPLQMPGIWHVSPVQIAFLYLLTLTLNCVIINCDKTSEEKTKIEKNIENSKKIKEVTLGLHLIYIIGRGRAVYIMHDVHVVVFMYKVYIYTLSCVCI